MEGTYIRNCFRFDFQCQKNVKNGNGKTEHQQGDTVQNLLRSIQPPLLKIGNFVRITQY